MFVLSPQGLLPLNRRIERSDHEECEQGFLGQQTALAWSLVATQPREAEGERNLGWTLWAEMLAGIKLMKRGGNGGGAL